ncbi:MAG: S8 family serine peptidase [Deltaproteobacteria bacterium]|nr:S8 family serine peptidase [Deltaproteobacteria bacterium]
MSPNRRAVSRFLIFISTAAFVAGLVYGFHTGRSKVSAQDLQKDWDSPLPQGPDGAQDELDPIQRPTGPIAVANSAIGGPEVSSKLRQDWRASLEAFKNTTLIDEQSGPPDETGAYLRKRLVKSDFKHPYLLLEDRVILDPASGEEVVLERNAMVANQLLVTRSAAFSRSDFEELLASQGASVVKILAGGDLYQVEYKNPSISTVSDSMQKLRANKLAVLGIEPNILVYPLQSTPNDPEFSKQWHYQNNGQFNFSARDADIDLLEAWQTTRGDPQVVVGVIDEGIDFNHVDLAGNIWINPNETAGDANSDSCPGICNLDDDFDGLIDEDTNGCSRTGQLADGSACNWANDLAADDDENGYPDDINGWNFVNNSPLPSGTLVHGTHVAGTIAARADNNAGVTGVAPQVRLMPLQFLSGFGTLADAIEAIDYATNNGATLTSNSWGGGGYSTALQDAIQRAGQRDILFIAAAGNSGLNHEVAPGYPANYNAANIISVAATGPYDELAYFSDYGPASVDLAAPGDQVYSTLPGNSYGYLSGTSMATPHVSGAAALLLSAYPNASAAQIKEALLSAAEVKQSLEGKVSSKGRLNVERSLAFLAGRTLFPEEVIILDATGESTKGNGDDVVNPAETFALAIPVRNTSATSIDQVTAKLQSASPFVEIVKSGSLIGNVAPGQTAVSQDPFIVYINPQLPVPSELTFNFEVTAPQGFSVTSTIIIPVHSPLPISGRILLDGKPAKEVEVFSIGTVKSSALTSDDGTYTIGATQGHFELAVAVDKTPIEMKPYALDIQQSATADFNLTTAIKAKVSDVETGDPIANALIEQRNFSGYPIRAYTSDANGFFTIVQESGLSTAFQIKVQKPGSYAPSELFDVSGNHYGKHFEIGLNKSTLQGSELVRLPSRSLQILDANNGGDAVGYYYPENSFVTAPFAAVNGTFYDVLPALREQISPTISTVLLTGINDAEQIIGYGSVGGVTRAFRITQGAVVELLLPAGHTRPYPTAINEQGDLIVGYLYDSNAGARPVMWNGNGEPVLLPTFENSQGLAFGINSNGVIIGYQLSSGGHYTALLWRTGAAVTMEDLGAQVAGRNSYALGITESGEVLGVSVNNRGSWNATVWNASGAVRLPLLDRFYASEAYGAMPGAEIVAGLTYPTSSSVRANIWRKGTYFELSDFLKVNDTSALSPIYDGRVIEFYNKPLIDAAGNALLTFYDYRTAERGIYRISSLQQIPDAGVFRAANFEIQPTPTPTPVPPTPPALNGAPNDFDGDGESDIGVSDARVSGGKRPKPNSGKRVKYFIQNSSSGATGAIEFGSQDGLPAHGRYLPDSSWQLAYVSASESGKLNWNILNSADNSILTRTVGKLGDTIVAGCDLDGLGQLSDMAVVKNNTVSFLSSESNATRKYKLKGLKGSKISDISCADFDGDGADELVLLSTKNVQLKGKTKAISTINAFKLGKPYFTYQSKRKLSKIFVSDFDADGAVDIAAQASAAKLHLIRGDLAGGAKAAVSEILIPRYKEITVGKFRDSQGLRSGLAASDRSNRLFRLFIPERNIVELPNISSAAGKKVSLIKSINVHFTQKAR